LFLAINGRRVHRQMKSLTFTAALLLLGATSAGATGFDQVPKVYVDYPNGSFFRQCDSSKVNGVLTRNCHGPAPLRVRPASLSVSVNGDGNLLDLNWSIWSSDAALGTGLRQVRCVGNITDPKCRPGTTAYTVPATVRLSVPVSTARGMVFTVLKVTSRGHVDKVCLPPAQEC
jgi:hypothetical protein